MPVVGQISPTLEDYIEIIFDLIREGGVARVKEVAEKKSVAMASVNNALKKLVKEGLISHESYGCISLTGKGANLAKRLSHRHSLLKTFLEEIINVDPDIANADACAIEHHVHKETIDALTRYVSERESEDRRDLPHLASPYKGEGSHSSEPRTPNPEPRNKPLLTLREIKPGESCRVEKMTSGSDLKKRLLEMGIHVGEKITVDRVAPLGDPISIKVKNYHLSLRKSEAAKIIVSREEVEFKK